MCGRCIRSWVILSNRKCSRDSFLFACCSKDYKREEGENKGCLLFASTEKDIRKELMGADRLEFPNVSHLHFSGRMRDTFL